MRNRRKMPKVLDASKGKRFRFVTEDGRFLGWIHRATKEEAEDAIPECFGLNSGVQVKFLETDQN